MKDTEIVSWGESFATGIESIDNQHKTLVKLTNELYQACLVRDDSIGSAFRETMSRMVEYVRFHFTAELELLKRINYPDYLSHKKQHDTLILHVLAATKDFGEGKKFTPNQFVRTLKDWIFGHIAVMDKVYSSYIIDQKNKGLLTDIQTGAPGLKP